MSRIYLVASSSGKQLVEAANASQAIRHAVRSDYTASVATQAELVALVQSGVKVERATKEAAEPGIVNGVADGNFAEVARGKEVADKAA